MNYNYIKIFILYNTHVKIILQVLMNGIVSLFCTNQKSFSTGFIEIKFILYNALCRLNTALKYRFFYL